MCLFLRKVFSITIKITFMADNKDVKSKRELFSERMRGKYPDRQFDDDEALFGQINDDYDDYDNQLKGYKEREDAMSNLFTSDPRSAKFLTDWRNGKDPAIALVDMYGEDFVEDMKDPAKRDEVAKASKAYAERIAKEKEYKEQYDRNIEETRSTVEKLQEEEGLTDEQVDAAMEFLITIMKDGILGKFSADSIHMAMKAINHDDDVNDAANEAELRGRNARIKEQLRKGNRGDGLPQLGGKNNKGVQSKPKSIFDLAKEAG